jgi:UDP-N-acetyl-D-glucosamine dehydrogenase
MPDIVEVLKEKIEDKSASISVIGLGYVGLPLAAAFAKRGYLVIGLDVDEEKIAAIERGGSYILDVAGEEVARLVREGRLRATTDYDVLKEVDVIFICVPTPFDEMKAPDLSFIVAASEGISTRLKEGQLVILQSTTYPGTTEEVVLPILEKSGLKAGLDFHLAFSPERVNPGDKVHTVENTPKVLGGITPACAELARYLLSKLTPDIYIVSSTRVAEMTKLLENIYRSVNIALVNELAILCERMGIDIWEVIEAAKTKPFGFMPFYPGPGVGGHCIPVDPYYLSWKAREYDFYTKFIELAAEVNQDMPYHVVEKISGGLNSQGKSLRGAKVLILGVAFKRDVDDARNSPAQRVIELLLSKGAEVSYNDPYVPSFKVGNNVFYSKELKLKSVDLTEEIIRGKDCVVIVAGHSLYDYDWIVRHASLVVDTVNATKSVREGREKVLRIGAPNTPHASRDT